MVMTMILLIDKNIESTIKLPPMNTTTQNRYTSIIVVNGNQLPDYTNSSISGDSEVSSIYTYFVCGMDGHLSRFCSQMQSLADCGPNNNMLYPHGLPVLVNNNSHEQDVQAADCYGKRRNRFCTQSFAKCNRRRNRFWAYSEVTSDEDVSIKGFVYESWNKIPMK